MKTTNKTPRHELFADRINKPALTDRQLAVYVPEGDYTPTGKPNLPLSTRAGFAAVALQIMRDYPDIEMVGTVSAVTTKKGGRS